MADTLSAIESSQPFPACTKCSPTIGLRIRIVSHTFPMMPVHTRSNPGTMRGIVPARPGIFRAPMLTDIQTRKAKAADRPYKLTDGGG